MPALLPVLLALTLAGCQRDAAASPRPVERPSCPVGEWADGLVCVPALDAFRAPTGTTYVVDQNHAYANDDGPGSVRRPWRTIGRAARAGALRPGDAVVIREGVYREAIRPRTGGTGPEARVTFAAYPGERVVISGADVASGWRPTPDGAWRRAWTGPSLETYSDDDVFRREVLVADGRVLRAVRRRSELAPGRFVAEGPSEAPTALVAQFSTSQLPQTTEVGHRSRLFWPEGPNPYAECGDVSTPGWLRVVGLTFRHASNRAQWGTFCAGSVGGLVEDVRVEWTIGQGIDVSGRDHTFRRTRSDLNGQMGWGGSCRRCVIEDGTAIGNNWVGHDPFWEAGGMKLTRTSDTVVRRHYAAHNGGPGIWLDIDNTRNTVEGNLVVSNQIAGIMLELATTETLVQHNVVSGTRWVSWSGAGVLSQAASRNAFVHNTIVENEGTGLWLRLDPSRRAPDGGNVVVHNKIVGNAASGQEAREIAVEGTSPEHVRSTRFRGNAYGRIGSGLYQSTFYLHPVDGEPAGYRGGEVRAWRQLVRGDQRARLVDLDEAPRVGAIGEVSAGAPGTSVVTHGRVGADPTRVRSGGEWRRGHSPPSWPR